MTKAFDEPLAEKFPNMTSLQIAKLRQALHDLAEQANCNHVFSDEHSETTCYKCGLEVNF